MATLSSIIVKFVQSMVTQDVALSAFLVVVEMLMDAEFICPCDTSSFYAYAFVFGSSTIIFFLIVYVKMVQYKKLEKCSDCIWCVFGVLTSGVLVVLVWFCVVSFDGHYYVCMKSSWNGTWTSHSGDVTHKWCQPPADVTNFNDLQRMSAEWYFRSKVWLMHFLLYSEKNIITVFSNHFDSCINTMYTFLKHLTHRAYQ